MAKRDYYEILGISRDASEADIKRAYRRLAMKYHPDRNPDDKEAEQRFKEAKEAYEVLTDPERRTAYDQFGHAGVDQGVGAGTGAGAAGGFSDIFGDIFGDFFGGGRGRVHRGADLQYTMDLTLEKAVSGTEERIRIPTMVECGVCNGSGARKGSQPQECPTCHGHGQVRMQQGFFSIQQTCPRCRGSGVIISDPCTACHGQGRVQEHKTLTVKIPPGVDTGDRIRLNGEGEPGEAGAPPGDLYVVIRVKEHEIFKRQGNDLFSEVPIDFVTAALGGEVEVPTLDGRVELKIPQGTQSGRVFRLRGKGIRPVRGGPPGDLLCRVMVETPVKLTRRQKDLLREFRQTMDENADEQNPKASSWFEGVKRFFEGIKLS